MIIVVAIVTVIIASSSSFSLEICRWSSFPSLSCVRETSKSDVRQTARVVQEEAGPPGPDHAVKKTTLDGKIGLLLLMFSPVLR